ncbi:hypothetical protein K0C01_03560 [Salinarchaeum sp. IM2453]|uniref:DUF5779 family protein n=1 Tax=Salinarchaeum sp. IM2453 TaxID=2862870 RepID=UPI001C8337C3|nr:DUF5779 family protein [Salinarchaeum sp. IM2453]QZA89235.1 hypothetical protein K0C01_03560 [Salinarchaeum sp. IM2453]
MSDFGLDLQTVEQEIQNQQDATAREDEKTKNTEDTGEETRRIVLDVLDGTANTDEWTSLVQSGTPLVLAVEGDIEEGASPFVREIVEMGGDIVHFRSFLIVVPPEVEIDNSRL